jgi:hypothetical protein
VGRWQVLAGVAGGRWQLAGAGGRGGGGGVTWAAGRWGFHAEPLLQAGAGAGAAQPASRPLDRVDHAGQHTAEGGRQQAVCSRQIRRGSGEVCTRPGVPTPAGGPPRPPAPPIPPRLAAWQHAPGAAHAPHNVVPARAAAPGTLA